MTGFPLFRLPLLPLKDVLNKMSPGELTMLYLCSEKTQNFIKVTKKSVSIIYLTPKEKEKLNVMEKIELLKLEIENNPNGSLGCFPEDGCSITIIITDKLKIHITSPYDYKSRYCDMFPASIEVVPIDRMSKSAGTKSILKIDDITVPVKITDNRSIRTISKAPYNGLNSFIDYFKKFFNTKTLGYFMDKCNDLQFSQNLRMAVDGLKQQTINSCFILNHIDNEDYKYILDNVKPTIRFEHTKYHSNQINDFQHETNIQSTYFKLSHANWFSLDNLIRTSCEEIDLGITKLTNSDMYEYLKLWMDGKYPKLIQLSVQLQESVDLKYIFDKLQSYSERFEVAQQNDIIRITHDGTVVTISNKHTYFSENMLEVSISLELLIDIN